MIRKAVKIEDRDTVLTVLEAVTIGDEVSDGRTTVIALEEIPIYHKIALVNIQMGDVIYKYGEPMGYATAPIRVGQWVHSHNVDSRKEGLDDGKYKL